ncbi:tyrosine-type recombinase/integrase [Bradyrhizobium sp. LCT2]|uniref:tyrosine-type recombinase/integrase n=1 Tax=Bradyrhizobium sp. LCT2 TaxID=2493093 RepID=UPI001FEFF98E|nr:tyrosine-type recombinase/integrase [Bradyrhizobium sp. LCT2]
MEVEEYLGRSRLYRRLRAGPHGQFVERYAARLVEQRIVWHGTWRCLNVVGGLLSWIAGRRYKLVDLDEQVVEQYLRHRGGRQSIQAGDRAALKRWLSVLREEGAIAPLVLPPLTPHERIFKEFLPAIRARLGPEVHRPPSPSHPQVPARGVLRRPGPLCKISQEDAIRYVERHAQDWSPGTGKAMCWSLRAFLRYLHHRRLNSRSLADCVPSMRRWKLATLPTHLPAAQVRKALDGCDRETVMGRRDYAILLLLAKLGLRADEVATLTLDDIDWRASEILVRAKGRQRARMPIPPDVGAAIVAYLRNGRPKSSCRRLFVRTLAPHVGFASGCAITMIAKAALDRVGIEGCAHRGAHIFRHSLATELLRSGATLSEIGQLLRHESDVRGFARHVANFDPRTEVSPVGMLPGWKRAKPYVYSDAEIDALLTAALALPPADGLRRWTYHTLFGLIAVTGIRISEAMGLERDDVDLDAGVLTVRLTKFGKSRLVPLHPTTRTALRDYAHRRDALLGSRCGSTFFVAEQGGRLLHQYVHRVFWRLS